MRAITQSISALVIGLSSFAATGIAQADGGITVVYSSGSHIVSPYAVGYRYYQPHRHYRGHVCRLPHRGHINEYRNHHDYDRHDHRRDEHRFDRHSYRRDDRHEPKSDYKRRDGSRHQQPHKADRGARHSRTQMTYTSRARLY